jgi:hypothetical protein
MEGKSVEEIMQFMDENERKLAENPFNRKSAKDIIVPENNKTAKAEEKAEQAKAEEAKATNEETEESSKSSDKTE